MLFFLHIQGMNAMLPVLLNCTVQPNLSSSPAHRIQQPTLGPNNQFHL